MPSEKSESAKSESAEAGGAADAAVAANSTVVHLPLMGRVVLPAPAHLAWYAGIGALVAVEVIEWPVALVLVAGKMLADNRSNSALRDFGNALEEA